MADVTPNLPATTETETTQAQEVTGPTNWFRPLADVAETDHGLELWLDVPGVKKDAVKLEVEGTELRVEAPRDEHIGYRRAFTLPRQVDPAGISAQMNNGVLHLVLPRAEAFSRRVIEIA